VSFRCALASLGRQDPLAGTASTVRAYLLVEDQGPWGVDALRDSRVPADVLAELRRRTTAARVRPLLVRRPLRADRPPVGGPVRVFAAYVDPVRPWLETATLSRVESVLDLDIEALGRGSSPGLTPSEEPLFCVCTHGRHDVCCAERGRPVAAALAASHPAHSWEVSHIGGDRFAANLLVLPHGLYYGRVEPASAPGLVEAHLRGELDLELLRGRSSLPFAAQVAEIELRRRLGVTDLDAVRLEWCRAQEDRTVVVLVAAGVRYRAVVGRGTGAAWHQLTCRATRTNPVPELVVESLEPA
jgi:hypothetical protein